MFKTIIYSTLFIIPLCTSLAKCDEEFLEDTKLLMTFLVHRHGDRTPTDSSILYATDEAAVMKVVNQYGYGQLTDVGKKRGYQLGKFIRQRYDELLSSRYNDSEIYIRSTDSTRTKMTVLAAMSAVYSVEESWCQDSDECNTGSWTPVPYTTVPPTIDFNLPFINCPIYVTSFKKALRSSAPQMNKYADILDRWTNLISVNLTAQPAMAYVVYDFYTTQRSMGVPLTDELEKMFSEIEEVAGEAMNVILNSENHISLGAGVLLQNFLDAANSVVAGEDVPRVYVYSAHDVNVFSLMAITKARPMSGVPKYGAAFALELRKVQSTGQYIVVPVYLKNPENLEVSFPTMEGCDVVCELSRFQELVSENLLDQTEWMTQCEWSADFDFNLSLVV